MRSTVHATRRRRISSRASSRQCEIATAALLAASALIPFGRASAISSLAPPSKNKTDAANFKGKLPITELNEQEAILHALNRLGFGSRPGEVEEIEKEGLDRWIQAQLHPETIDDHAMANRLAEYPVLERSSTDLLNLYPQPQVAAKRMGITVEEYQKRMQELEHPPQGMHPAASSNPQEIVNELSEAKLLRAIYSERQLDEQLANFWFNHFNVFIYKDLDHWYMPSYERDAIRPHVLGKFRDLLEATAKSPAMLFYLDNSESADPRAFDRLRQHPVRPHSQQKLPPLGGRRGLNENYGRELMELHTLGVDGGYTQQDVIEVAKCFTGWTIESLRDNPKFYFDDRLHDPDAKRVLGKKIHAGGIKDGEKILDLLAKDPHTAHHISLELAQYFVADNPPEALVQRMTKTFEKSKGDLRAVMTTMIYSPEFWSRAAYRAKVKTPFELVASTVRALGADVDQALPLVQWTARIGEPLYQCLTPNGYSDQAGAWISTGALLNRLNFAIALASDRIRGTQADVAPLVSSEAAINAKSALDSIIADFLGDEISGATRATLDRETSDPRVLQARLDDPVKQVDLGLLTGLVLGSPEFQKR